LGERDTSPGVDEVREQVAEGESRAGLTNMKKVLFVCTANICRSPMAGAMFDALAEEKGLPYEAASGGVAALIDEDIAPNARIALEEVGIYAQTHHARQVSEKMLKEADLVLTMEPRHVATLRSHFGDLAGKLYTLREYVTGAPDQEGIPDPYGHTMPAYRASLRQLLECIERLIRRLESEEVAR